MLALSGSSSLLRLEDVPKGGDVEDVEGAARREDGAEAADAAMETLDQVMPPMEKRETVREVPL